MNSTILFRKSFDTEEEFKIASKYFDVVESRTLCKDSVVISRYSYLPYGKELDQDLRNLNCIPINSFRQHRWIASFEWYEHLKEFTPKTWTSIGDALRDGYDGPFVIKGETNSRKYDWDKAMFAVDAKAAHEVTSILNSDSLIGTQQLQYRQYVPLKTFEIGLNGIRFTNEFRVFCYKNSILTFDYYWSSASDETIEKAKEELDSYNLIKLVKQISYIASQYTNFYVLDIAETTNGNWILIEVNDGTMSGLSEIKPDYLYRNLKEELTLDSLKY